MKEITIEDVLKKYIYKNIEGFGDGLTVDGAEQACIEYASLNRQGCRWTKASERLPEENKLYIIKYGRNEIQYASLFVIKHKVELKMNVEWLDESIEPCATSSENYWKQRCEAAEGVLKVMDVPKNKSDRYGGNSQFELFGERNQKWQQLSSQTPSPTGDRDCEELKKEVEYYKGLYEQSLLDINNLEEHNAELQSQCTEKEKELQTLRLDLENYYAAIEQIEELKAENERMKYLVELAFWADDIIKFKEDHGL